MGAYLLLVVYRGFVLRGEDKTSQEVAKIHATKLMLNDVLGKNLPQMPSNPDSSIAGVDANRNGIRDDVELAIFKEYPNSAKTRAVLLQYALALQMEMVQTVVNKGTVIAVAQEKSQAAGCISEVTPRTDLQRFITATRQLTDFIKKIQINTSTRDQAQIAFYKNLDSYSDLKETCDIELSTLPN